MIVFKRNEAIPFHGLYSTYIRKVGLASTPGLLPFTVALYCSFEVPRNEPHLGIGITLVCSRVEIEAIKL